MSSIYGTSPSPDFLFFPHARHYFLFFRDFSRFLVGLWVKFGEYVVFSGDLPKKLSCCWTVGEYGYAQRWDRLISDGIHMEVISGKV